MLSVMCLILSGACSADEDDASATDAASPVDAVTPGDSSFTPNDALVIAHRGAAGYRPEHTLPSYELAIEQGADYIELDLVITSDGVLIARHENELSDTTDVAARGEFAARMTNKTIDGIPRSGWFAEDFTLSEIKILRARERLPSQRPDSSAHDGMYEVPTLNEIIAFVEQQQVATGRPIGLYIETKHPSFFAQQNLALEPPLLAALDAADLNTASAPVFIQSFEVTNLKELDSASDLKLIQLLLPFGTPADKVGVDGARTYMEMLTVEGLAEIATYADGIGPHKGYVIPRKGASLGTPTELVDDAHAVNLLVHPYTFRNENMYLPREYWDDPVGEIQAFLNTGIDGFFTDFPDTGVAARDATPDR